MKLLTVQSSLLAALLVGLGLMLGCAPDFNKASELRTLRVLGVKKDTPYASAGQTVHLTMLWHDASDKSPRTIQIAWLAACYNPASDLYSLCFSDHSLDGLQIMGNTPSTTAVQQRAITMDAAVDLGEAVDVDGGPVAAQSDAAAGTADAAADAGLDVSAGGSQEGVPLLSIPFENRVLGSGDFPATVGYGESFSFRMPSKIVTSRAASQDPNAEPYGIAYVFFAVCAGEVRLEPTAAFPLTCYDGATRLGSADFVAGYSQVYAYGNPTITNTNPQIESRLLIDGKRAQFDCIGENCSGLIPPASSAPGRCDASNTLALCQDKKSCPRVKIKPLIDLSHAPEADQVFNVAHGENFGEQMWINYYADRGEFRQDLRLLNDAVTGWNSEYEAEYLPTAKGTAHLWAVVHDNRGGTQWMRTTVCIQ